MPFCNSPIKKFSSFIRWIDASFYFLCLLSPTLQPIFIFRNQRFHVTHCLFIIFPLPLPFLNIAHTFLQHPPSSSASSPIDVFLFAHLQQRVCPPLSSNRPQIGNQADTFWTLLPDSCETDFIQLNAASKQTVWVSFWFFKITATQLFLPNRPQISNQADIFWTLLPDSCEKILSNRMRHQSKLFVFLYDFSK